jgi:hypothetical protein
VFLDQNQININVRNLKKSVTLWLSRDMIDFTKPVTIRVNGAPERTNKPIKPSLNTLLEDFYLRGDRHRLFLAKLELKL